MPSAARRHRLAPEREKRADADGDRLFEAEIGHLVAFMAVVYMAGCVAGLLRYR